MYRYHYRNSVLAKVRDAPCLAVLRACSMALLLRGVFRWLGREAPLEHDFTRLFSGAPGVGLCGDGKGLSAESAGSTTKAS